MKRRQMLLILNRLLLFNSFTREILSHYIQYIQRKDKILFWVCQFNASITDLFVAWLCSKWDRFPAHYRSLVYCELRLGILGQLHPVDQVLHHKQAWNIQTSCLFHAVRYQELWRYWYCQSMNEPTTQNDEYL